MDNRDLSLSCDSDRRRCSDNDNHSDIFRDDSVFIIQRERIEKMESMIEEEGRYSAESVRISRAKFDLSGLDRLANRSRALANDTLYFLRQYYFYHNTSDPEKKTLYHRNIDDRFYRTIKESDYPTDTKNAAVEILNEFFEAGLRALGSTVPTIMKFMESYKDIGYSPCAQQIVIAVCGNFLSHLKLIRKYYHDLKIWNEAPKNRRGQKPSRPSLPKYIGKKIKGERQGKWKLIYTRQRLAHTGNKKSLRNALDNNRYTCCMYVPPSHEHLIPPIRIRTKVLEQLFKNGGFVEIIPKGRNYSFNIHYYKTKPQRAREYGFDLNRYEQNPNRAISIDFGVNNFLTVFNNFGAKFPIFKGSAIKRWNHRINHKIPALQRESDVIADVLERYEKTGIPLESIINSRIHIYHDEFGNLKKMILYIFRRIFELSKMDKMGVTERNFVLKCFHSKLFFRVAKNLNWDNFKKLAEKDGKKVYSGIFNKVRKIILMEIAPCEKYSLLHKYFHYLKNKRDYKLQILGTISGWSIQDLQDYLGSLGLRIDELWDKYNRVKRDAINKIAKKLMYYCLYYGVGTITIGYNKGWQNRQNNTVKLKKITRDLFVSLPFNQMFERIQQEAIYFGINVDYTPEWYTSKCSYIDDESIGKKPNGEYAGLRRFTQNGVKHNGLFRSRNGYIIHGDVNGAANIGKKGHPKLFSKKMIAYNLELVSDPRRPLTNQVRQKVTKFIITPPIKFSPSNGHPTIELKRKERLNKSKVKPQRYQMSPNDFLKKTLPAYV